MINLTLDNKIDYHNSQYPIRIFEVTLEDENHDYIHQYVIAPESLFNAISNNDLDDSYLELGTEEYNLDSFIYFYIDNELFNEDAKEICEKHLDIPMKFVKEITIKEYF